MHSPSKQQIDKELVRESFRASGSTYEDKAVVQKIISRQLVTYLGATCRKGLNSALEIGCCTGYLTELLCNRLGIRVIYLNDLVEDFCTFTNSRLESCNGQLALHMLPGDIESLQLPNGLDLVVSSSTLQWMDDLDSLLKKICSSLNPGGHLAFSIFGPGTMREISEITGRGLLYYDEQSLKKLVLKEFSVELFTSDTHILHFPSVRAVLRHIQQTGVGGLGRTRWTKSTLQQFEYEYKKRFSSEKGLSITYCSNYVVARKKD